MTESVTIGKILKPIGLTGEVKVLPLTAHAERFERLVESGRPIEVVAGRSCRKVSLARARTHSGFVYLSFEGWGRSDVEAVVGGEIRVSENESPPLPEGSYYHADLLGMAVITEQGMRIGTLAEIFPTGSNDVFVIREGKREILIPATRSVVRAVDAAKKEMIVRDVEALL